MPRRRAPNGIRNARSKWTPPHISTVYRGVPGPGAPQWPGPAWLDAMARAGTSKTGWLSWINVASLEM